MAADYTGTSGDNTQTGTSAAEVFDYSQGGHDTLDGAGGNDEFDFGTTFDLHDSVTGGDGYDILVLEGDYSMTLAPTSFTGIDDLKLMGADKVYHLKLAEENVGSQLDVELYGQAVIDGSSINAGQVHFFTHSAAPVTLLGGAGADAYLLDVEPDRASIFDGGAGFDVLTIQGAVTKFHAADHSFRNIDQLQFNSAADITFADDNVAGGAAIRIYSVGGLGGVLRMDGHKEVDGHFVMNGGGYDDVLTGGHQGDTLRGGGGDDRLEGGQGQDRLHGGHGADRFVYNTIGESRAHEADIISGLGDNDTIDLGEVDADRTHGGLQHFSMVDEFSGAAGEMVRVYSEKKDVTRFMADVDGDGKADFVIRATGDHTDFDNFNGVIF
jgi:Ca2+-binding RTX toxin-like protein